MCLASAKLKNLSLAGWLNCVKAAPIMSSSSGSSQPASILPAAPILHPIIPPSIVTSPIDIDILLYLPHHHVLPQQMQNLSASLPLSVPVVNPNDILAQFATDPRETTLKGVDGYKMFID